MKELTKDEKIALLVEVNKLLATIPDYQLALHQKCDNHTTKAKQMFPVREHFIPNVGTNSA